MIANPLHYKCVNSTHAYVHCIPFICTCFHLQSVSSSELLPVTLCAVLNIRAQYIRFQLANQLRNIQIEWMQPEKERPFVIRLCMFKNVHSRCSHINEATTKHVIGVAILTFRNKDNHIERCTHERTTHTYTWIPWNGQIGKELEWMPFFAYFSYSRICYVHFDI